MATVPVSQGPTVESRPAAFVPQNAQFDPNAFGAGVGQAAQGLGGTVGAVGEMASKVATDLAIQSDTRAAKVADTQHQQAVTSLGFKNLPGGPDGNRGYYSLSGQAAVDAQPIYEKALGDSSTALGDTLKDTPRAQNMYQSQAGMRVAGEQQRAAVFAMHQGVTADNNASSARLGAYNDSLTANFNDPAALDQFQAVTRGEVSDFARRNGLGTDQTAQMMTAALSKGYSDAIRARAAAGDTIGAATMFGKLAPGMDAATRVSLGQHLEPLVMGARADSWVKGQMGTATPAGTADDIADAIHWQESRGHTSSATSVDGAQGDWQVIPATFSRYAYAGEKIAVAADNERVARRFISDLNTKFNGDAARVAVGYFSGEGNVSPAGSVVPWKEDKRDGNGMSTSAYVSQTLARMKPSAPAGDASDANMTAYPDFEGMAKRANDTFSDDPRQLAMVQSRLSTAKTQYDLQHQAQRDAVQKSFKDTAAALEAGNDTIEIPEAQIRSSFRAGVAGPMIQQLQDAKTAGQVFAGMQFATPAAIAASRQDLATGVGPLSDASRLRHGMVSAPPGAEPEDPTGSDATDFSRRQHELAIFDSREAAREAMIAKDPVAYVGQEPSVAAAYKAAQASPNDPALLQAAIAQSQSVQRQVGVPAGEERVVPVQQANDMVKKIHSTSPEQGSVGTLLNQLQQQFGASYPQLTNDLAKAGLSPDYQMLAHANLPAQATVRDDLQRALQMRDSLKDKTEFGKSVPHDQKSLLGPAIDTELADFRATTAPYASGSTFDSVVQPSVTALATYYASKGMPAADAAEKAATLVNSSYDYSGVLRTPKGYMGAVKGAGAGIQARLTDADLKGTTADEARRNGVWVTNAQDNGVSLYKGTLQGGYLPIRRANGQAITFPFNNIPTFAGGPAPGAVPYTPSDSPVQQ